MGETLRLRAGMVLAIALGVAALFPAYWAAGGESGLAAVTGSPGFRPPWWLMALTALLLFGWMMIVLGPIGVWGQRIPPRFFSVSCCIIAFALLDLAAAGFQSETGWERAVAAPAALLLAFAALMAAGMRKKPGKLMPW